MSSKSPFPKRQKHAKQPSSTRSSIHRRRFVCTFLPSSSTPPASKATEDSHRKSLVLTNLAKTVQKLPEFDSKPVQSTSPTDQSFGETNEPSPSSAAPKNNTSLWNLQDINKFTKEMFKVRASRSLPRTRPYTCQHFSG